MIVEGARSALQPRWVVWVTNTQVRRSDVHIERRSVETMCSAPGLQSARSVMHPSTPPGDSKCRTCLAVWMSETTHRAERIHEPGPGESKRLYCVCGEVFGGETTARLHAQHRAHITAMVFRETAPLMTPRKRWGL